MRGSTNRNGNGKLRGVQHRQAHSESHLHDGLHLGAVERMERLRQCHRGLYARAEADGESGVQRLHQPHANADTDVFRRLRLGRVERLERLWLLPG